MIHNISDVDLWEQGTTTAELQNRTWEQLKYNSNSRIRTKNLFLCSSSLKVKISSNYNIDLLWFNEEGLMISEIETNWLSGNNNEFISISVPNDAKQVGILVKFTDNSDISPSEILNTNIYYDDGLLPNNSIIAENIIDIIIGGTSALKMYIGNELIWIKQQNQGLPSGWKELEYIESTSGGGLYIDLNIRLYETLNTQYDIAIKFSASQGNPNLSVIFNCLDTANEPWPGTFIRTNSGTSKVVGRYIGGSGKDNTLGNVDEIIELTEKTSPNKNVMNLNNNNSTHSYGTSLFCAFEDTNDTPTRLCVGKIYYFKLFVEGTLVRDLIPCQTNEGDVGMYDLVNRVLYVSPNNSPFEGGPVKLPRGYTELEYISSTSAGGQYIETGLKMWTTTPVSYELDMKVYMSGAGKDNTVYPTIFGNNREVSPYPGFVIRNELPVKTIVQDLFPKTTHGENDTVVVINQLTENITVNTHNVTTTLFCGKDKDGVPWRYANCRIYYCKIRSNSDTWQRDFVPCLNPDGIAGLYDKVEGKFYSSPNGVAFEYGEITQ